VATSPRERRARTTGDFNRILWSGEVARLAGVELPLHPLRRQSCLVQLGAPPVAPLPTTLDRMRIPSWAGIPSARRC
jgi:hypothetical protein